MNLFEYEGKQLMRDYGIPVPESHLITCENEPAPMAYPFVLKAQVMTGGPGESRRSQGLPGRGGLQEIFP